MAYNGKSHSAVCRIQHFEHVAVVIADHAETKKQTIIIIFFLQVWLPLAPILFCLSPAPTCVGTCQSDGLHVPPLLQTQLLLVCHCKSLSNGHCSTVAVRICDKCFTIPPTLLDKGEINQIKSLFCDNIIHLLSSVFVQYQSRDRTIISQTSTPLIQTCQSSLLALCLGKRAL